MNAVEITWEETEFAFRFERKSREASTPEWPRRVPHKHHYGKGGWNWITCQR